MNIELPLDVTSRERVRAWSKLIFGGAYELELLVLIAQNERFYHGETRDAIPGLGGSQASTRLKAYRAAGLIVPIESEAAKKYQRKRSADDPLWAFAVEWTRFLTEDGPQPR